MDKNWHNVMAGDLPPRDELVEWQRDFDDVPILARWSEFYPEFNIYGLWWRSLPTDCV